MILIGFQGLIFEVHQRNVENRPYTKIKAKIIDERVNYVEYEIENRERLR